MRRYLLGRFGCKCCCTVSCVCVFVLSLRNRGRFIGQLSGFIGTSPPRRLTAFTASLPTNCQSTSTY